MRAMLLAAAVLVLAGGAGRADEEKVAPDKLPKAVAEAVKKRFPKGEVTAAVRETDKDKKTSYEVTVKDGDATADVTVTEGGGITAIEKLLAAKDLPKAVADAVAAKFPKGTVKKAEEVISVKDGKESTDYFEVVVEVDGKEEEVEVLPTGKLKEEKKPEKKDEPKKDEKKDEPKGK